MGAGAGAQTYADTEKEGGGAPQQQHAGLGRRLLQWAERLAWEAGFRRVAIISGVGVRRYYARLGSSARPLSLSARLEPLYTKPLSDRLFPLSSRAAESTGSALAAPRRVTSLGCSAKYYLFIYFYFLFYEGTRSRARGST